MHVIETDQGDLVLCPCLLPAKMYGTGMRAGKNTVLARARIRLHDDTWPLSLETPTTRER